MSFFAIGQPILYLLVKLVQTNYHTIYTPLDNIIPFIPHFIYIYNLFYSFIILSYYYLYKKDEKNFNIGIKVGIISTLIAYIIFIIYPTIMIRPNINVDSITSLVINTTYKFDNPAINCFPSIHCIFCFTIIYITTISSKINIKSKTLINALSFFIIISTVLVKQHYVLDILGAFTITIIITLIIKKLSK